MQRQTSTFLDEHGYLVICGSPKEVGSYFQQNSKVLMGLVSLRAKLFEASWHCASSVRQVGLASEEQGVAF